MKVLRLGMSQIFLPMFSSRTFMVSQLFLKFFIHLEFIFILLQSSAFSPHPSTPPQPVPHPSPTSTLSLDFVLVSFIVAPIDPSLHYPLPLPCGYCYNVLNFNVSGYILFAFFFC